METASRDEEAEDGGSGEGNEAGGGQADRSDGIRQIRTRDRNPEATAANEGAEPGQEQADVPGERESDEQHVGAGAAEKGRGGEVHDREDEETRRKYEAEAGREQSVHAGSGT